MKKVRILLVLCGCWSSALLSAQTVEINNSKLWVRYDAQHQQLQMKDKSSGKLFVQSGHLEGAVAKTSVKAMRHPVFGEGKEITIQKFLGGSYKVALYAGLPFVMLQESVFNKDYEGKFIDRQRSYAFAIDLQQPLSTLKTLGTGGLLAPDKNPGSYVFLTAVHPATRNGVVAGWLTHERGDGVLFSDTTGGRLNMHAQIDYGRLMLSIGNEIKLETLLIGYFDDARLGEEAFADALAKQHNVKLPERQAVYCSWYSEKNGGAGNSTSTKELASFAANHLKDYGFGVIQLDDQWQDGPMINGPARGFERAKPDGPYPNGMTEPAKDIVAAGLKAGIWWMPFARNHQAPEYANRQHWFARRLNGMPYETKWGGTSLDLTHPEVQRHIAGIASDMKSWGYRYFKMDGLWTGTVTEQVYINDGYKNDSMGNCLPLYNKNITQVEAFRSGLKLLRNTVGNDVFFSGCCVSQNMRSFGASIGLVNAMRVGPDFNHDGQSIRTGAIRASRLYFLNGRIWWNDPDPSIIRESGTATADGACKGIGSLTRARLLPSWVSLSGQFFLSSDWIPDLPAERIDIMKKCMASHNGTARPVDAFDKSLPSVWLTSDKHSTVPRNVIGLFNWDTARQTIASNTAWAGLQKNETYYAFDFWDNKPLNNINGKFSFDLPGESCKIIAVRAKTNHPVLVSTSKHITQGMIDVENERWTNTTLSGQSKVVGGDPYELRIAGLADNGNWEVVKAAVNGKETGATIQVLPATEKGWVRVLIQSKKTATVQWRVQFKKS